MSYRKRWLKLLIEHYGEFCAYCGTSEDLHVDHVEPLSCGGEDIYLNLKIACKSCNSAKKNYTLTEFRLAESLKASKFGRVINRNQYTALFSVGLIEQVELIEFHYELKLKG